MGIRLKHDAPAQSGGPPRSAPGTSWLLRRAVNLAGLLLVIGAALIQIGQNGSAAVPLAATRVSSMPQGQVAAMMNWPLVDVHSVLLSTGSVLMWDAWETGGAASARLWNPTTKTFTPVPNSLSQIFCSGHVQLADGRILTVGGHNGAEVGIPDTNIFDPATNTWSRAANMHNPRWYASATELGDGRVVTISGQISPGVYANTPEIYDPLGDSWTPISTVNTALPYDQYPLAFLLPNGKVASFEMLGGNLNYLDAVAGTWTAGPSTSQIYTSAAMYRPGKLLITGGGAAGNPSLTGAQTIDLTSASPAWTATTPMTYGRYQHNLVVLPDGNVLAAGGSQDVTVTSPQGPLPMELWNPNTGAWTTMASLQSSRMYHSTAMLLPDATVLIAGGGRITGAPNQATAEIYSPPYLFSGARPTITSSPSSGLYGASISVGTPDAASIASMALVGMASNTHTLDMDQRYVPLTFTSGPGGLNVQLPGNSNLAPPGQYMLFAVNAAGVPSVAATIQLQNLPTVYSTSPASGSSGASLGEVTAKFSQAMAGSSLSFSLRDGAGSAVPGTTSYDAGSATASFLPSTPLAQNAVYSATLSGISQSGHPMGSPFSWSFSTQLCPCSLFPGRTPANPAASDTNSVEIGIRFNPDLDGFLYGVRYFKAATNTGPHPVSLWSSTGTRLASAMASSETASGWQQANFVTPIKVTAGTTYVASYHAPAGNYSYDSAFLAKQYDRSPLHAPAGTGSPGNGLFSYGPSSVFPTSSYNSSNYWIDVTFNTIDTSPPVVVKQLPVAGASDAGWGSVAATFNKQIQPASLVFTLTGPGGAAVGGASAYDSGTLTATFTPSGFLAQGTGYTVAVQATDMAGNAMPAPTTWTFTTQTCPCNVFGISTPANLAAADTSSVELGTEFTSDANGFIYSVRWYKSSANSGQHTVSLWTAAGALLATATATGETASGWQQTFFATPVSVSTGSTYVASYHAPAGGYSYDGGYFVRPADKAPLHALAGSYAYGSATTFPNLTFNSTNYWVDVSFSTTTLPLGIVFESPGSGAVNAGWGAVTAAFNRSVVPSSIVFTLKDPNGAAVAGDVSWSEAALTATFTPTSHLTQGTAYTASVSATDQSGTTMTPFAWSFTTRSCPCNLFGGGIPANPAATDSNSVELGTNFTSDYGGYVRGVRFYKAPSNTGSHAVSLWSAAGGLLATATATGETASGWQQAMFAQPVAIAAGATYVASYHAPVGNYAYTAGYLSSGFDQPPLHAAVNGGVYAYGSTAGFPSSSGGGTGYWVDPVYDSTAIPLAVATVNPAANASAGGWSTVTATFNRSVVPSSISFSLKTAGIAVAGSVTYDDPSHTATFTPAVLLAQGTAYTATITASDASGPLASPYTWWFTTQSCPCNLLGNATPANLAANDPNSVELGVRFSPDTNGFIYGVRFYKSATNTGAHTVSLWTSTGTLLATANVVGESAAGWQQANFGTPIAVTAGSAYVASYHAPVGRYSFDSDYFTGPLDRQPLHAAASNGLFAYGPATMFPTQGGNGTNYWVDVVYNRT